LRDSILCDRPDLEESTIDLILECLASIILALNPMQAYFETFSVWILMLVDNLTAIPLLVANDPALYFY
jgi:hypothetical protein